MVILIASIILILTLPALVIRRWAFPKRSWERDVNFGVFLGVLTTVALAGGGLGLSALVTHFTQDRTAVMVETTDLRALDTGSDADASFFLGTGYSESGPVYTYLVEREDGGFEMSSIWTGYAVVYQGDYEPRAVKSQERPTSTLWSILPLMAPTRFYVPEGSVQEPSYRVDVGR